MYYDTSQQDPRKTNQYYDLYKQAPSQSMGSMSNALGGTSGGEGMDDIDWSDFASTSSSNSTSRSYTGLPSWLSDWAKSWWGSYNQGMSDLWGQWHTQVQDKSNLQKNRSMSTQQLQDMLKTAKYGFSDRTGDMKNYVEQARTLMPEQYRNQMDLYTDRSLQPVLNRMSDRGILNSSVTSGALSDVLRDQQAKYLDEVSKANLWAANQNYDTDKWVADTLLDLDKYSTDKTTDLSQYFTDKDLGMDEERRQGWMDHFKTQFGMLPSLLNAIRESQSESQGNSLSNSGLMELLAMMFGE